MDVVKLIDSLCAEAPEFHIGETETLGAFGLGESFLAPERVKEILSGKPLALGIGREVLELIGQVSAPGVRSLEIGAGYSTLVFAACGARHTAVTPSKFECDRISSYARDRGITMDCLEFINQPSEKFLPNFGGEDFDIVLLDGKHAFPWPMLDWFFTAERLRKGGLLIVDDIHIPTVRILHEFLSADPRWMLKNVFDEKTSVFERVGVSIHDVAWHMQSINKLPKQSRWTARRIKTAIRRRLDRLLKND